MMKYEIEPNQCLINVPKLGVVSYALETLTDLTDPTQIFLKEITEYAYENFIR